MHLRSPAAERCCRAVGVALTLIGARAPPLSGQMTAESVDSILPRRGHERAAYADYSWTLQTVRGDTVPLERFKGKVLFINVWATWCAPCVTDLQRYHHDRLPPVFVEWERMPDVFGLEALPTSYIVDRRGRIVFKLRGTTNWDTAAARELLRALAEEAG